MKTLAHSSPHKLSPLFIFVLLFSLVACSTLAPSPTPTATSTPPPPATSTPTPAPTSTSSATPTASSTPIPITSICSPLADHELARISDYISHDFNPPAGSNREMGHHGVDFSYYRKDGVGAPIDGTPIQSMLAGRVAGLGFNRLPYGNMLVIETPYEHLPPALAAAFEMAPGLSLYLLYAHLLDFPTHLIGAEITCGETLGQVGNSGFSGNPHLHLETRVGPSGIQLPTMIFYDTTATLEEQAAYVEWRTGETFILFDPTILLTYSGD